MSMLFNDNTYNKIVLLLHFFVTILRLNYNPNYGNVGTFFKFEYNEN